MSSDNIFSRRDVFLAVSSLVAAIPFSVNAQTKLKGEFATFDKLQMAQKIWAKSSNMTWLIWAEAIRRPTILRR